MADSPLQKAPSGLLELFNLRTQGQQPILFGDRVQPVVEGIDFYSADIMLSEQASAGAGAFPRIATVTFSSGVRLLAASGNVLVGAAAGTAYWGGISMRVPSQASPSVVLFMINTDVGLAGSQVGVGGPLPHPLILPAGSQLLFALDSDAAGADHLGTLTYLYAPLTGS